MEKENSNIFTATENKLCGFLLWTFLIFRRRTFFWEEEEKSWVKSLKLKEVKES